jgi:hypothetical protein
VHNGKQKLFVFCFDSCVCVFQAAYKSAAAWAGSANIRTWHWLRFVI